MSWTSWGSDSDTSGDNGWWMAAMAAYSDYETGKEGKKQDIKDKIKLAETNARLSEEAYQRRLAERNASLAPYEKYATEQQGLPLETLSAFGQPKKGLLTYGG